MPLFFRLAALALIAMGPPATAAPASAPETGACSLEDAAPATVALVDDDLDLLLDDGRRVLLAGLEFARATSDNPELGRQAAARLAELLVGKDVFVGGTSSATDRWGRIPARIFVALGEGAEAPLVSAGSVMLAEGHARFRPDPPAGGCAAAYLAAEAEGRARGRGLWTSADYAIMDVGYGLNSNYGFFLNRKGMILIEGLVTSVGEAGGAIYLNFGPRRGREFAVVVSRRNLGMFEKAGVVPRRWTGRRVRARGLIDTHFGPRMEIASPAQIELLDHVAPH